MTSNRILREISRWLLLTGTVLPLLFLIPCSASAKSKITPSISTFAGRYDFDSVQALDNSSLYGLRVGGDIRGKDIVHSLSVELVAAAIESHRTATMEAADVHILRLDFIYPLHFSEKLLPFVALGAGGLFIDSESKSEKKLLLSYGLGSEYSLTGPLALRLEARHNVIGDHNHHNNFEYTAGLIYHFGQPKKRKPKPPADSDRDGVPDIRDECPDSPKGLDVDKRGCPLNPSDTDKDGVPDYQDKCTETPAEVQVDDTGCPVDHDGDGIPDSLDKCPGTPGHLPVDTQGCIELKKD